MLGAVIDNGKGHGMTRRSIGVFGVGGLVFCTLSSGFDSVMYDDYELLIKHVFFD